MFFSDMPADRGPEDTAVATGVDPPVALSEHGPSPVGIISSTTILLSLTSVLKARYVVNMLPQPDLLSVEEHFVASGREALPLVGVADLEPDDLLGVAHATLMRVPLDVLQHDSRVIDPLSGLRDGTPGLSRYGFIPRSRGSDGLALTSPARAFDSEPARFVPARPDTPTVAPASAFVRSA